jgi:hypothetical protein
MDMSFREKIAWSYLVTTAVVFVPYFVLIFRLALRGELVVSRMIVALIVAVIVQVLLSIAYHLVILLRTREEPKDERDRAIENTAFRRAHWTLVVALWLLIPGGVLLYSLFPQLVSVAFLTQLVFLSFVVSELVHYGTQAYCYRLGG